jgi:hypothetical protein
LQGTCFVHNSRACRSVQWHFRFPPCVVFVPSSLTSQPPTGRPPLQHVRRASPSTRPAPEMDLDAPVILRCALINCDDSQTMIVYHPHPARADADFPIQINMHTTFPVFYSVHSVHSVGSVRAEYSRNAVAPESSLPQVLTQSHCPDNVLAPPIGAGGAALARVQLTSSCVRPSCIARYHPSPGGRSIRAQPQIWGDHARVVTVATPGHDKGPAAGGALGCCGRPVPSSSPLSPRCEVLQPCQCHSRATPDRPSH